MTGHQPELINWFRKNSQDTSQHTYNHIDLCDLDANGMPTGRNIIEGLLKNDALKISIKPSSDTDRKLFQLFLDHKNKVNYDAFPGLGIGFPIIKLSKGKNKETCMAPLFIWSIQLEQQPDTNTWQIRHDKEDTIRPNNALYHYIKTNYKIDLSKLAHPVISSKRLTTIALSKICYELSSALGKKEDLFLENIERLSNKTTSNILCSGVLGNFTDPLHFSESNRKKNTKPTIRIKHPFSTSILDPWQERAFKKMWQQAHTKIVAEPGTGKSHLLHYTLINGLSNGLTSIVIADSVKRISKIRNEFSAQGLDQLMLDLTNPDKDFNKIIQALSYKSSSPKEEYEEAQFKYLVNLCQRHKDRLDNSFRVLNQSTFDKKNWPEIVGNYLKYNRSAKQELLNNQLNAKDFTFHPTEYLSLKEAVNISESIYRKLNTLRHPLHNLHPDIFLEKTTTEALTFIEEQVAFFHTKFDQLHHRYILKQEDYARNLNNNHEAFHQESLSKIEQLKDSIEDNRLLYGTEFEESSLIKTGRLKVYGVFSGKHKNILQARNLINEQFKTLRQSLIDQADEHFDVLESIDSKSISKVSIHLNELEDQLYSWREQLPDKLQEVLQRLNTKSVHSSLDYAEQISELEYSLDIEIEMLNAAGLFHLPLENKMLTIPMRQLFIQEIITQLQTIKNYLNDFNDFYEWQRHWLLLPEIHRKLLTAIIKVNPSNWKVAFQSWFFYQKLKLDFHFKVPKSQKDLLAFEKDMQSLQNILPIQIRQKWKQKAIKRKSAKELSKLSLEELFSTNFELLSQQFPVIVMTNAVAAQLINDQPFDFDLGFIFDNEAPSATTDQAYASIAHHTLSFSSHLEKEQSIQNLSILNNVHKKIAVPFFDFSNHLIHQGQKSLSTSEKLNKMPFQVKHVSGQFRQGINTKEAETIIRDLINKASYSIPKIAVVCSTIEQRNYIARKISGIISSGNSDANALKKLEDKGLSIFHLQEVRTNDFEQLFFSLSIDNLNYKPGESQSLLNNKTVYKNLTKLIDATFLKVHLYHSIPTTDLDTYLSYKTKKTTRLIAAWIKYAEAIINNDQATVKSIFDNFPLSIPDRQNTLTDEIANELSPFIGKNRIQVNHNLPGICLPLVIAPITKKGKSIAILRDGALNSESTTAHLWNIDFIRQLKSRNLATIPVWSANWFENPALEARRLASAILKMDKEIE